MNEQHTHTEVVHTGGQERAIQPASLMSADDLVRQVALVQDVMKRVMKEGTHYGKIPGTGDKPSLLKAGAEVMAMTFRLKPQYRVTRTDMENGHREYEVTCILASGGEGVGSCSTLEGKYRYRTGPKEFTQKPVPKHYWDLRGTDHTKAQQAIGGKGHTVGKHPETGEWVICVQGEKVEHDNPADYYNTVLKMAKKRAFVDAVLTNTACSDIFTQDVEDMPEVIPGARGFQERSEAATAPNSAPPATQASSTDWEPPGGWQGAAHGPDPDGKPEGDEQAPGEASAEVEAEPAWRSYPVPFGKAAGCELAKLDKNILYGFWANYTPKPFRGRIQEKDKLFRQMLDEAGKHYNFKKDEDELPMT